MHGKKIDPKQDIVIGCYLDMKKGTLSFSIKTPDNNIIC